MRVRFGGSLAALVIALGVGAAPAYGDGWAGSDPASNFAMPYIPQSCWDAPTGDPTGAACLDFSVNVLNQARASLGQPAYVLPADFDSLSPEQQLFILTNDDRVLYGLSPVPGLTDVLSQDAAAGVQSDGDPSPTGNSWQAYTSNWAGGYENAVLAYEGWMYDDGPGSGNLDCTSTNSSGCWGHRHDILWQFDGAGAVGMGAAAGADSSAMASYAMLLVQGGSGYQPNYSYTWAQAVADGAGGPGASGSASGSGSDSGSTSGSAGGSNGSGTASGTPGTAGSGSGPGSSGTGSSSSGTGSGSSSSHAGSSSHHHPSTAHGARVGVSVERLRVHRHRIGLHLEAPHGLAVSCSLRLWTGHGWRTERSKGCASWTTFRYVPSGHYRLRISSSAGTIVRRLRVR